MSEFKNCPFCGGEPDGPNKFEPNRDLPYKYYVGCCDCEVKLGAYDGFDTPVEAIKAWNERVNR